MRSTSRAPVRARGSLLAALVTLALARPLHAESPPRFDISAAVGFAFPAANLQRGSRLSDATFGAAGFELGGAYRVSPRWAVGFALNHGLTIPTLCVTSEDCIGSLGRDTRLGMLGRWRAIVWHRVEPHADFQFGYEWLKTELEDKGATSARRYRGPYAALSVSAQYVFGKHCSIGPELAVSAGSFQSVALSAPGIEASRGTDGAGVHAWLFVGARALVVL